MADILSQPGAAASVSIIPYYLDKGKQTLLLGTKSDSNKNGYIYTDFGGESCTGRYSRNKETPLQCGLRHLQKVFDLKDISPITHVILLNKQKPYRIIALFKIEYDDYLKKKSKHSIKSFEWMTVKQLMGVWPMMLSDTLKEFRLHLKKTT